MSKGNHCETHALQVLHHLDGSPAIEGDLPDVEPFPQPFDELFDEAVVYHVSLCGLEETLLLPKVLGNMVAADAEIEVILWNPEVGQDREFIVLVQRREHQHESRDVGGGGQVQTAIFRPSRISLAFWCVS